MNPIERAARFLQMDPLLLGMSLFLFSVTTALLIFFILYQRRLKRFNMQLLLLEKKQQQLLLEASLRYQEEERKRLAANLHDDAGPLLATAKLYLNDTLLEQDKQAQAQAIASARAILDKTIQLVRSISHDLIPPTLKNFGLHSALYDLIQTINGAGVVTASGQFSHDERRFSEEKEMIIYRIALELLNNILKHSAAGFIDIQQVWYQQQYQLLITHDGKGLTQQDYGRLNNRPEGMGLKNIASRIRLLEGTILFEKELNKDIYSVKIIIP